MLQIRTIKSLTLSLNANPIYIQTDGMVLDEVTKEIYLTDIAYVPWEPYYSLQLEFDSYVYQETYNLTVDSLQREIREKIYILKIIINLQAISKVTKIIRTVIVQKLSKIIKLVVSNSIRMNRKLASYCVNDIKSHIKAVEENFVQIFPHAFYRLTDKLYLDYIRGTIITNPTIHSKTFNRRGGIIETNNVSNLVSNLIVKNTLIIGPKWITTCCLYKGFNILTYEELSKIPPSYTQTTWSKILIHELHPNHLIALLRALPDLKSDIIWVVNNFPLRHYFHTLTIHNFYIMLHIWLLKRTKDVELKRNLMNHIMTHFSAHYAITEYPPIDFPTQTLQLNSTEQEIYHMIDHYYHLWRTNSHQSCDPSQITSIKRQMINTLLVYISNIAYPQNLSKTIKSKISSLLNQLYTRINQPVIDFFNHKTHDISCNDLVKLYKKYHYFSSEIDHHMNSSECPICYDNMTVRLWTHLVCGHNMCLECLICSLAKRLECPMCRNQMTCEMAVIVKDKFKSDLNEFIEKLSERTIILTSYRGLKSYHTHGLILDITQLDLLEEVEKLTGIEQIYVLKVRHLNDQLIDSICNYLKLKMGQISVQQIEISI